MCIPCWTALSLYNNNPRPNQVVRRRGLIVVRWTLWVSCCGSFDSSVNWSLCRLVAGVGFLRSVAVALLLWLWCCGLVTVGYWLWIGCRGWVAVGRSLLVGRYGCCGCCGSVAVVWSLLWVGRCGLLTVVLLHYSVAVLVGCYGLVTTIAGSYVGKSLLICRYGLIVRLEKYFAGITSRRYFP